MLQLWPDKIKEITEENLQFWALIKAWTIFSITGFMRKLTAVGKQRCYYSMQTYTKSIGTVNSHVATMEPVANIVIENLHFNQT